MRAERVPELPGGGCLHVRALHDVLQAVLPPPPGQDRTGRKTERDRQTERRIETDRHRQKAH